MRITFSPKPSLGRFKEYTMEGDEVRETPDGRDWEVLQHGEVIAVVSKHGFDGYTMQP